jgi:signal transduction histidine kinase
MWMKRRERRASTNRSPHRLRWVRVMEAVAGTTTSAGRLPKWAHPVGLAVLVGGLYALGAELPFWFLRSPAAGAPFFPSAGVTLAALVLTRRRDWPLLLAVVAVAEVAVDLQHHQTVPMALGFAAANVVEPLIGAVLLRRYFRREMTPLGALACFLLCAVVFGPMVGGAIGASVSALHGTEDPGALVALKWWIGDGLGVLVVATPVLAWAERRRQRVDPPTSVTETLVVTALVGAVTFATIMAWDEPLVYIVIPVLMWAALRGGVTLVATAGLAMAFIINWAVVTGRAGSMFLSTADPETALLVVQLFIAVALLSALTLAAQVAERMHAQRALRASERARLRADLDMLDATAKERQRIASEVHDIVGHALNVVLLQAGGARRIVADYPQRARELMESIESTGRDAFRDLDAALGLVEGSSDPALGRGLADLDDMVGSVRSAGVAIDVTVEGEPRTLPRLVDWSAFRIVQEALTNVIKHAKGTQARVSIHYDPEDLRIEVTDGESLLNTNGHGAVADGTGEGRGLIGMRERVTVLGGQLDAGVGPHDGFVVRACIPTERTST